MPHGHPLPSEHERPMQLPSMTAAAVCTRMLHNLWKLNSTDSTFWSQALLESGMRQLPSRLSPCLLQLAPRFISSEALAMLPVQLNLEVETGGPVELYIWRLHKYVVRVAGKGELVMQHTQVTNTCNVVCYVPTHVTCGSVSIHNHPVRIQRLTNSCCVPTRDCNALVDLSWEHWHVGARMVPCLLVAPSHHAPLVKLNQLGIMATVS